MSDDVGRFREAQDAGSAGGASAFVAALRELRAGRKTGHWIWYVFPQLRGLGRSPMAVRYGLNGAAEAAAYLRDPVLVERLVSAAAAVRAHLERDARLDQLMGSDIDALKLVSSMTLFTRVARNENVALAEHADAILAAAAAQGYQPCAFTIKQLG
jgi:uncharacterized protein (DUF1810 family)